MCHQPRKGDTSPGELLWHGAEQQEGCSKKEPLAGCGKLRGWIGEVAQYPKADRKEQDQPASQ